MKSNSPITILMVDDDADDRDMVREALSERLSTLDFREARDGREMLAYLQHESEHPGGSPRPDLILLDLNMPRLDGREALGLVKQNQELRGIPVVVLTTSDSSDDIRQSYRLGASSYVIKPPTYASLTEAISSLANYWFHVVALP